MESRASASVARPSLSVARSSEVERIVAAADVDTTFSGKKAVKYRGRRSTWPGALGLFLIFVGSIGGLTYFGIQERNNVRYESPSDAALKNLYGSGVRIADGKMPQPDPDATVTNPEFYTDNLCEQPNYISKGNRIIAQYSNGRQVVLNIKGANWLGMQDNHYVPKGLWDGRTDGNTLYRIGVYLSENGFNAVRLPLSVDAAARNVQVDSDMINTNSNRALDTKRYISLLSTIIQGLGQFNIGVVLDFQVLSALQQETGLWEGPSIKLADFQTAISNLADELCNSKHFNVIGLDLKDDLTLATWGDGTNTDWAVAATKLGNYLLKKCPKWLVFIQGVQGTSRKEDYLGEDGTKRTIKYKYWAGSDLTGVATAPIQLSRANKVVYAPKYFTNSFEVMEWFFSGGTMTGDYLEDYIESSNVTLKSNVELSMQYMFGAALQTGAAVVLSAFGGLVGSLDILPMKTSTRIIEVLISKMKASNLSLAGGFWWELNPDAFYSYQIPNNGSAVAAGLVKNSWRVANMPVLLELNKMNTIPNVNFVSCM